MEFICFFCNDPLSPNDLGTYRRILGWVEYRGAKGGGNQVVLASEPSGFAHKMCVEEEQLRQGKRGPYQREALF